MTQGHVILYSCDPVLIQRIRTYLPGSMSCDEINNAAGMLRALDRRTQGIVLFDIRGAGNLSLLQELVGRRPATIFIAFGVFRSKPFRQAEDTAVYAVEPLNFEGQAFRRLIQRANDHLLMADEVRRLEQRPAATATGVPLPPPGARHEPALPLRQFFQPLRQFSNIQNLLQGIVDGIASAAVVLRAGIFAMESQTGRYQMQAGIGCFDEARTLTFSSQDRLVRWLELHAQVVARDTLDAVDLPADRQFLRDSLEAMGAELIVPLQGRQRMLGWLFLGRRATGGAFGAADLQDVMILAEHVSTSLENAQLYQEVDFQKTFAETLLHTLPTGIAAAAEGGTISWFNDAAEAILGLDRSAILGQPVEVLGTRIASQLRLCLDNKQLREDTQEWQDPDTRRYLTLKTIRLVVHDRGLGAVAFIHDRSHEVALSQKQRELERASFWTDVAASMSHEIRNPMVAIKTFAQLLPERYSDPEFRVEFSKLMSSEVDRLDAIIQQINRFANQPAPDMHLMNIADILRLAQEQALSRAPTASTVTFRLHVQEPLPPIVGDQRALTEALTHVYTNALEAFLHAPEPEIRVAIRTVDDAGSAEPCIELVVQDNAGGIPPGELDNIFSPFCSTRGRAMGLGL
ncbi:MAG: PAS domain-containing protein, partial [Verrucomicrobia bacterium]|nr:PAS domain-containing protein [Verrucomicrobiota bacterium]